jgi:transposase
MSVQIVKRPAHMRHAQGFSHSSTFIDSLVSWISEAHKSAVAKEALERIAALYAIEEAIRGHSAEERRAVRNERSKPLLESLKKWFEETLGKLSKKSDTTRGIHYALDRWDALTRYCDDGRLEIDNNAAERSLRGVVLGRRIIYFVDRTLGANAQRRFTVSSGLQNSTV